MSLLFSSSDLADAHDAGLTDATEVSHFRLYDEHGCLTIIDDDNNQVVIPEDVFKAMVRNLIHQRPDLRLARSPEWRRQA